jgi:hypothetical protein
MACCAAAPYIWLSGHEQNGVPPLALAVASALTICQAARFEQPT